MSNLDAGEFPDAFTPPDGFDAAARVVRDPWDAGDETLTATVVFDSEVAWIARRELGSRASIVDRPDGSIEVAIDVAAPTVFIGWLIGFEDHAVIVGPPELRGELVSLVGGG
jgi:predicted DNA-binding transcriptional regulator YafY